MTTLILPPRYSVDSITLYQAATVKNWQVERLQGWRIPENFATNRNFAIYGESLFGAVVCEQLNLGLIEPNFNWLDLIPEKFKLREIKCVNFAVAKKFDETAFFKPAVEFTSLSENTPVIISEPVKWDAEFRFFIAEGEIQTVSPYSRNGELIKNENEEWLATAEETENAFNFCQGLIKECPDQIPPAIVIDVGEIVGKGWAVVEANPCWASGIYGCDPTKVLQTIKRACLKIGEISDSDAKWIIERND